MPTVNAIKYSDFLFSNAFNITLVTSAHGIYPIIKPPVTPNNTPKPPVNDEYTGSPVNPIKIYTLTATVDFTVPSTAHAKNIAKLLTLIGTNPTGIVKGETTHKIAVKSAIIVRSFTEKAFCFSKLLILILRSLLPMKRLTFRHVFPPLKHLC